MKERNYLSGPEINIIVYQIMKIKIVESANILSVLFRFSDTNNHHDFM